MANIQIELPGSVSIPMDPSQSVVIENEDVVTVQRTPSSIVLWAKKTGTTFLLTWDAKGALVTQRIDVSPPGTADLALARKQMAQKISHESDTAKLNMMVKAGNGTGTSLGGNALYPSTWNLAAVGLSGNSLLGTYKAQVQMEARNTQNRMVLLFAEIQNPGFNAHIGDSWAVLTPLSASYLKYQGASLTDIAMGNNRISVFGGKTGSAFWGSPVWASPLASKTFLGGRVENREDKNMTIYGQAFQITPSGNASPFSLVTAGTNLT